MQNVRVHYVGDLQGICRRLGAAIDIYGGCAWWNTIYSTCDIFLWDMTGWLFEPHERRHCAGEDHL